jgi:WNK lysine deficient protein kinase
LDTALSVASEMIAELDIMDQDVISIAGMIDGEIASLVPEWRTEPENEETTNYANQSFCDNCVSNHTTVTDFLSPNEGGKNLQLPQCCTHGCASMHGRFEEIIFQSEEYDDNHISKDAPNISSELDYLQYQESWNHHESRELSPVESSRSHSGEQYELLDNSLLTEDKREAVWENSFGPNAAKSSKNLSGNNYLSTIDSLYCEVKSDYEKEIQHELRWLKAKYQTELRELRDQQFVGLEAKSPHTTSKHETTAETVNGFDNRNYDSSYHSQEHKSHPNLDTRRAQNCAMTCSDEDVVTAKSFYTRLLLPDTLHRTVSLPVDAVDV